MDQPSRSTVYTYIQVIVIVYTYIQVIISVLARISLRMLCSLGSGPRYMIRVTLFCTLRESENTRTCENCTRNMYLGPLPNAHLVVSNLLLCPQYVALVVVKEAI